VCPTVLKISIHASRWGSDGGTVYGNCTKEQVETLKKECAHYKRISEEADKQCDGCAYKIDFPSSVHCFGCARMYSDHYAADNKH